MSTAGEEYLTVEQLAQRLGWTPKTVQNKMGRNGIFKKRYFQKRYPLRTGSRPAGDVQVERRA
jgi:hypothetical protein